MTALLLLAGIAAIAYLLRPKPGAQPGGYAQPAWTPEAKGAATRLMTVAGGGQVHVFKPAFQDLISQSLEGRSLLLAGGAGGTTAVYQLIPGTSFPAAPAVAVMRQSGQVVLGSYSLAMPDAPQQLLSSTTREIAAALAAPGPDNGWAVFMAPDGWLTGEVPAPLGPSVPGGGGGGLVPPDPYDADLPQKLRAQAIAALANAAATPASLDELALVYEHHAYHKTAALLRARAKELRAEQAAADAIRGGVPYTIRQGDIASAIAQHYTGRANAWRELPAANPGMSVVKAGSVEYLKPWQFGQQILLPLAWQAREKSLPPLGPQHAKPIPDIIKPEVVIADSWLDKVASKIPFGGWEV